MTVESSLEASHRLQPVLNTNIAILDGARPRAEALLSGYTVALKDLIDQAGQQTTCGSAFYRETASKSAIVVERLEKAGAVIVSRNNLHEFAFGFSSENDWFGPVRNPWDLATSTGGSSGGTAASVAAGMARVGIGTGTGGSIRVPAAMCGIMGLKVTHNRVPLDGVFPLATSVDTVGPFARTVADLTATYRVISGDNYREQATGHLRLGVPQPWVADSPSVAAISSAFSEALASLAQLGHEVVEVEIPEMVPPGMIVEVVAPEVLSVHGAWYAEGRPYGRELIPRIEAALAVTPDIARDAQEWRRRLIAACDQALSSVDLLITPSVPNLRKVIGEDLIGDLHYRTVVSWFAAIVNHTGCPAISLPLLTTGQPPPSLQFIAPRGKEGVLLDFGAGLEAAGLVGYTPPPIRFDA